MEKDAYETYEFIPQSGPSAAEMNPLFVLQDDGTILITQVEEGKENVEPCAVFEVASHEYYVDVDNTTQLISVPDQFTTATDENNINSYLLQPTIQSESTPVTEQMDTDPIETKPELMQSNVETITNKPSDSSFTEITLNNEQYQMLEQKGWVLLECYEKIFVLNTLGLHDITDNEKLILKLKAEIQEFNQSIGEPSTSKIEIKIEGSTVPQLKGEDNEDEQLDVEESIEEPDEEKATTVFLDVDVHSEENIEQEKTSDDADTENGNRESMQILSIESMDNRDVTEEQSKSENSSSPIPDASRKQNCDTLKIKTKYIFTDIPPKVYLGKTPNGKKLYAKITKTKHNRDNKDYKNLSVFYGKKIENNSSLTESQFINIIQDSLRGGPQLDQLNVPEAELIMAQLLKVPEIRDSTAGNKLIMTKILLSTNSEGKTVNQKKPMITTGVVKQTDNGKVKFMAVPKMLQTLTLLDNTKKPIQPNNKDVIEIFHLHILELNEEGKAPNQTIHLSKRKLSLDVIRDTKKRHPDPVYACGACAAVFKSETTLKEHQESQCFADDALTIDTHSMQKDYDSYYTTIDTGTKKLYSCRQCGLRFSRLFNCRMHIKTHDMSLYQNYDGEDVKKPPRKVYKCTMCPSTYFHPSSLSKHILKMHIHV